MELTLRFVACAWSSLARRRALDILARLLPSIGCVLFSTLAVGAATQSDAYLAGYAAGLLKRDFSVIQSSLVVRHGVITVPVGDLSAADRATVLQLLTEIPGVAGVKPLEITHQQALASSSAPDEPGTTGSRTAANTAAFPTGILPTGHLFKPLLADPRWAHFSAAYRNYVGNSIDGNNNASVSFGEMLPFYRANLEHTAVQWETGLQAGVFSDFNLDARSSDLINSDFIVAAYGSMRVRQLSALGRIYHQSSHLGDEFVLSTQLERVNLSYEGADLKLSYEFPYGIRIYGGGGGIFNKEPSSVKTWSTQYGFEYRSPWRFDRAALRPIFALDIKNYEQNNWNTDVSARGGVQFDNFQAFGRKLQFLIEYFNGRAPTGQFYKSKVEYVGIGAHYHY
jgi:Protein of unknown function (DUF1207)